MNQDILLVLKSKQDTFSKGQKRIAQYILDSYDKSRFYDRKPFGKNRRHF